MYSPYSAVLSLLEGGEQQEFDGREGGIVVPEEERGRRIEYPIRHPVLQKWTEALSASFFLILRLMQSLPIPFFDTCTCNIQGIVG